MAQGRAVRQPGHGGEALLLGFFGLSLLALLLLQVQVVGACLGELLRRKSTRDEDTRNEKGMRECTYLELDEEVSEVLLELGEISVEEEQASDELGDLVPTPKKGEKE